MATIEQYETAKGRLYRVRYRTPDNKPTSKRGFKTKKEASLFLANLEVAMSRGEYVSLSAGKVTVGELAPAWLAKKRTLKKSAYAALESAWRVYVEPRWGAAPVRSIRPSDVEAWIAEIATGEAITAHKYEAEKGKPRSATTVLRAVGVLAGILDSAVKQNRLTKNPARNTDNLPRKKSTKRHRYLTHEEVARLAGAAGDRGSLVLALAYLGLRWGEATELRVGDVNPLRRRVHVERSATAVKRVIHIGPVKSWEDRIVPLPSFLMEVLAGECAGKTPDALIFPEPGSAKHAGIPDLRDDRNGWWTLAVREAGLDRLTPHDLRHTCASLAVSAGANVKALQRMLGHKSAAMTLDIYADLFDDDLDQVAGVLDQARSDALVSKMCPPEGAETGTSA